MSKGLPIRNAILVLFPVNPQLLYFYPLLLQLLQFLLTFDVTLVVVVIVIGADSVKSRDKGQYEMPKCSADLAFAVSSLVVI